MKIFDFKFASFALDCDTCQQEEQRSASLGDREWDRTVGDLSEGGNNLSHRQAIARARLHFKKFPEHSLNWNAIGTLQRGDIDVAWEGSIDSMQTGGLPEG